MSADAVRAPSGIVTFLFTDVEGSTRRWEADPDGMRAAIAAHDRVLRQTIESHAGWLFKHTGDGVCAAFASPRSAVDAAVAAQLALELPVRMGLATGEAELRDGDYFGAALNRAARVMAAGHGGQILLTGSTAGLLSVEDATAVAEICRRLDGIPLAIELAASRMASMTPIEVRDRLDHRFRLLVGSRRGLGRHQTLRHAAAWSYDYLEDTEKALLQRCSVFAGGFDLQSACAVAEFGNSEAADDYQVLDLLDALVRKSLLVADRLSGRTRYSMLETIREFAEEQLVSSGEVAAVRTAHAHHFARRATDIMAVWDSPDQLQAYAWFGVEQANLRTAFRWAADNNELDDAAAIATHAAFLGYLISKFEPITWAEELLEPAAAVDHPSLAFLYHLAASCFMTGRIEDAVRYADVATGILDSGRSEVPYGIEGWLSGAYTTSGHPERSVELCRTLLARGRDALTLTRGCLVMSLTIGGPSEEGMGLAEGLIEAAEATRNPMAVSFALLADGFAFRDADPGQALAAMRRGLAIAQDTGNHNGETSLAAVLCRVESNYGDPSAALDYFEFAIRNHYETGNTTLISTPLALLAAFFDRLGRYEAAATIAGFAFRPVTAASVRELKTTIAHLGEVLGNAAYESLARAGASMTTAAMASYTFHQIERARTELEKAR